MEKQLYKWFLNKRNKNFVVSGEMIKQKTKSIHSEIKETDKEFTASEGWLQKFKKRFGIRFLRISGEKLSSQPELIDPFKKQLKNKMQKLGITLDQLYNADETGLYWKLLPDKTFVSSAEKTVPGRKTEKQRITTVCTNATGRHKVIRFLSNKGLTIKALLLLDNAPSHSNEEELKSEDGQIVTMFLPPNVTPLIQPMNQNVIRLTKLYYRNSLLADVIVSNSNITDNLKNLTIKEAVVNLTVAWNRLDSQIIAKCWRNILENTEMSEDNDDKLPLSVLKRQWDDDKAGLISKSCDLLNTLVPQVYKKKLSIFWRN
ncbi:jerky protein homolog-like [Euwallacea similis]|uniref:jerky protein homolog-like n=1 Tax=Euwallacea similis TaxID=1736056 RepID=UPI00344B5EF8